MMHKSDEPAVGSLLARLASWCEDAPPAKTIQARAKELFREIRKRADVADVEAVVEDRQAKPEPRSWPSTDDLITDTLRARIKRVGQLEEEDRKAREAHDAEEHIAELAKVPRDEADQQTWVDAGEKPFERLRRQWLCFDLNRKLGKTPGDLPVAEMMEAGRKAVDEI